MERESQRIILNLLDHKISQLKIRQPMAAIPVSTIKAHERARAEFLKLCEGVVI